MGQIIRRVLWLWSANSRVTTISLRMPLPTPSSGLPEDSAGRFNILCLALLRTRFTWPPVLPRAPVVSYTTLSALPTMASHGRRSTLCCTFSRVAPGGCYPPFSPAEPGRSSARTLACRDAAVSPTHSENNYTGRRWRATTGIGDKQCPNPAYAASSTCTRIAPVPGQKMTSSGPAARMSASSAGARAMLLASEMLPRRRAAPKPSRPRSDSYRV